MKKYVVAASKIDRTMEKVKSDVTEATNAFLVDIGWDNASIEDYTKITVDKDEPDSFLVTVATELGYDEVRLLVDALDTVIEKYDEDAYFDCYTANTIMTRVSV